MRISNSAFDVTEVQEIVFLMVQLELNHLGRTQLRNQDGMFYTYAYIVSKWTT